MHSGVSSGKINALSDFSNIKFTDAILVTVGTHYLKILMQI